MKIHCTRTLEYHRSDRTSLPGADPEIVGGGGEGSLEEEPPVESRAEPLLGFRSEPSFSSPKLNTVMLDSEFCLQVGTSTC